MSKRVAGVLTHPGRLRSGDHACFAFADRSEFVAAAVRALQAGLDRGERVVYAGNGPYELQYEDLAPIAARAEQVAIGALVLRPPMIRRHGATDVDAAVRAVEREVDEAIRSGYAGLRIVVDATEALADPDARERFERFEIALDRCMAAGAALTLLCGFDRRTAADEVTEASGSLHPLAHGVRSTFRVFASDDHHAAVWGEVDAFHLEPWRRALEVVVERDPGRSPGIERDLDCARLRFVDSQALQALDDVARAWEVRVNLCNTTRVVRRLYPLVALDSVTLRS